MRIDLSEVLRLVGVEYKADYNGIAESSLIYTSKNRATVIYGHDSSSFEEFDPHDLFHERASVAISEEVRNHSMVCGTAYVYGGSWGISWTDIQKIFKERMVYDKNTDWLKLYFERYNFEGTREKHLLVTQFVNALIVERVEKEQGFSAVKKLLSSGNMIQNRAYFFKILDDVTGINESNFNEQVRLLIDKAMSKI